MIYFDWNAMAPISQSTINAMNTCWQEYPIANPSALHYYGQNAKLLLENARLSVLQDLDDRNTQYNLIFTASGTEANNYALYAHRKNKIFYSSIEHQSVLSIAKQYDGNVIECDQYGRINIDLIESLAKKNNGALFSIIFVNAEIGIIQDIKLISKIVHDNGCFLHTDMCQAIGKINVSLTDLDVDYATITGMKIGAPGVGCLIYKNNVPIEALIVGGAQELNLRAGTENISAILGMSVAIKSAIANIDAYSNIKALRDYIEMSIDQSYGGTILSEKDYINRIPNTSMITMNNIPNIAQVIFFDSNKIAISRGSACNSAKLLPSSTLIAIGISEKQALETIRISLGNSNTMEEAEYFVQLWHQLANKKAIV